MNEIICFMKKKFGPTKIVRSDKISNSVRPMSDKTPEYFDSTACIN